MGTTRGWVEEPPLVKLPLKLPAFFFSSGIASATTSTAPTRWPSQGMEGHGQRGITDTKQRCSCSWNKCRPCNTPSQRPTAWRATVAAASHSGRCGRSRVITGAVATDLQQQIGVGENASHLWRRRGNKRRVMRGGGATEQRNGGLSIWHSSDGSSESNEKIAMRHVASLSSFCC